jgi:hypothetical protein
MTKRKYVSRQIFEVPSKWGFIRAERSHGNTSSVILSLHVEDDLPTHEHNHVMINREQWKNLVGIVPHLMGWEVEK